MAGTTRADSTALERERTIRDRIMTPMRSEFAPTSCAVLDIEPARRADRASLPILLTVDDAADLLRTTRRAIYTMIERRQLPGVVRIRRRVLVRADDLLHWLDQNRALSPEE